MGSKHKKGFVLTELIVVIILVGILSAVGASLLVFFIQNSVYIPNKVNMDMLASDALNIMVEGDKAAKGLRFCKAITALQNNEVTFINQDNQTIRFRLDTATHKLYRTINGAAEKVIPYYATTNGILILSMGPRLFTYYDANQSTTSTPANVRWVTLGLSAQTGDGLFNHWQGISRQLTSIAVKRYQ